MAKGRHLAEKPRRSRKKSRFVLLVSAILLMTLSVGGTLAYIVTATANVKNNFGSATVSCEVQQNLTVKNTGNVDAYIRAAAVVNWVDSAGNVRGVPPTAGVDYALGANWTKNGSYYYYSGIVSPGQTTGSGPVSVTPQTAAPAGYTLGVKVVAEAIQAHGDTDAGSVPACQAAWGVTLNGG